MAQVQNALNILYNVETVNISDSTPIDEKIKTLVIVDPKDSFPESHLMRLEEFVSKGKNIFISYNRESTDLSKASGSPRHTGLEDWLTRKGINIEDQFVVDATCGTVT